MTMTRHGSVTLRLYLTRSFGAKAAARPGSLVDFAFARRRLLMPMCFNVTVLDPVFKDDCG